MHTYQRDFIQLALKHQALGFLPHERRWMDQLFTQLDYVDTFRRVVSDADEFTWFPESGSGDGSRVDYQVASSSLAHQVEYGAIYKTKRFSSHLPVIMDYDIEL